MTNIEKIKFDAKFKLKFMNNIYVLSGFLHTDSIHISEEEIDRVLEAVSNMSEYEWECYVSDFND